ncbi:MAG: cytochrome C oxidase subunit IV family protein [Candidatus Marinimicrobia bacterium]|jgi:caa(3)-type oxidase subunit IV|nr:cytochrome C oxidase subunit IV family protein [Candidatus Neomarinimicrobiota bacterium]MBT3617575.1 cytochrome C oxidase subunit IV family protein [Candidatus Neomarinimicrobiota bacterium]MBT3829252.1 cytochrome C oxidase subunit IV family protein [Candidatus Neomarinimicrobiota bacterium]MBT3996754.1 cytochrome C oxidase subunit IV family protein [Candidatus Neomarinimicrobiota bacterium]MBT4280376.1 cytochrome C oxidase subunit IV family protein [Candidatus Neomarinimicrobiota bacterium
MEDHKKTYLWNAIGLAILTVIEVWVIGLGLPRMGLIALLLSITVTKIMLVALVYMHLRYETKTLRRLIALPIPLALYFLWGVMYDLAYSWTM